MNLGAPEIIVIAIVVFALFGYKKLPDASRSVARSLHIFKSETKGLRDEDGRELRTAGSDDVTVNGRPLSERDHR
jgi:sec-independent protein translocase protein TatA